MSDDLVKRLRDWEHVWIEDADKPEGSLYLTAADHIEEMEAEIADLKAKLEKVVVVLQGMESDMKGLDYYNAYFICKDLIAELTGGKDG